MIIGNRKNPFCPEIKSLMGKNEDAFNDWIRKSNDDQHIALMLKNINFKYTRFNIIISGKMTEAVEPHKDQDRYSVVWFRSKTYEWAPIHFFYENKWHEIYDGDVVLFRSDKTHAVVNTNNKRWKFVSWGIEK